MRYSLIFSAFFFGSSQSAMAATCEGNLTPSLDVFEVVGGEADGVQSTTTIALSCDSGGTRISVQSGYVSARIDDPQSFLSAKFDGMLDTSISFSTSKVIDKRSKISLSADLNIPTGVRRLDSNQVAALADPDLVSQPRIGEGWNLGVGGAVETALADSLQGALGFSYTVRGAFVPFSDRGSVNPGDLAVIHFALARSRGRGDTKFVSRYLAPQRTKVDSLILYNQGASLSFEITHSQNLGSNLFGSLSVSYNYSSSITLFNRQPNEVIRQRVKPGDGIGATIGLSGSFKDGASYAIQAGYTSRSAERVDQAVLDFIPARDILAGSVSYRRPIGKQVAFDLSCGLRYISDKESELFLSQKSLSYQVAAGFFVRL